MDTFHFILQYEYALTSFCSRVSRINDPPILQDDYSWETFDIGKGDCSSIHSIDTTHDSFYQLSPCGEEDKLHMEAVKIRCERPNSPLTIPILDEDHVEEKKGHQPIEVEDMMEQQVSGLTTMTLRNSCSTSVEFMTTFSTNKPKDFSLNLAASPVKKNNNSVVSLDSQVDCSFFKSLDVDARTSEEEKTWVYFEENKFDVAEKSSFLLGAEPRRYSSEEVGFSPVVLAATTTMTPDGFLVPIEKRETEVDTILQQQMAELRTRLASLEAIVEAHGIIDVEGDQHHPTQVSQSSDDCDVAFLVEDTDNDLLNSTSLSAEADDTAKEEALPPKGHRKGLSLKRMFSFFLGCARIVKKSEMK